MDSPSKTDLQESELLAAIKRHPTLKEEALQGFADIEAGRNISVTVGELMESLENGEPIL